MCICVATRFFCKPLIDSAIITNNEFGLTKCILSSIIIYIIVCIIRIILRSCLVKSFSLKTTFQGFKSQFKFKNILLILFFIICKEIYGLDLPILNIIKDIIKEFSFNCLNLNLNLTDVQRGDMHELTFDRRRILILNTQWIGKEGDQIYHNLENWNKALENNIEYLTERMDSIPNRIQKLRNDTIQLQINLNRLVTNKQLISVQSLISSPNWNTVPNLNELNTISSTGELRACLNRWQQNVNLIEDNITMFSQGRKIALNTEARRIGINALVLERYYQSSVGHPDIDDIRALRKSAIDPNTGLIKILW